MSPCAEAVLGEASIYFVLCNRIINQEEKEMSSFFIVLSLLSIKQKEWKMWEKGGREGERERRGDYGKRGCCIQRQRRGVRGQ